MTFGRTLGATLLAAGAISLAACGSDKAAGPTTANNAQIVAEMQARLDSSTGLNFGSAIGFQVAITALSSGAPVNPTTVTIDGKSYRFNSTVMRMETRDSTSGDIIARTGIFVGWRNTTGDSVIVIMFAPNGEPVGDLRAQESLLRQLGTGASPLASFSSAMRAVPRTVSRSISAGPDSPALFIVALDSSLFASSSDSDLASGSISYEAASGECDLSIIAEYSLSDEYDSCAPLRTSLNVTAQTSSGSSEEPDGPQVTIPEQRVVGVTLVDLTNPR